MGPFSSTIKCQTKSLPPEPPRLECISITCNTLKLKWANGSAHHNSSTTNEQNNHGNSRAITYIIEMETRDGR